MTTPGDVPTATSSGSGGTALWGWVLSLGRTSALHARLIVVMSVLLALVALAAHVLRGPRYTATSSFTPEARNERGLSQFAGLAMQLGLSVGGAGSVGDPVLFYATLLSSRDILRDAVLAEYAFVTDPGSADTTRARLLDLYDVDGKGWADSLRRAINRLATDVRPGSYRDAGLVRLTTRARWAGLAVALNNRLLALVAEYNQERRQSQAAAERAFIQGRLDDARATLEVAEDSLKRFQLLNRQVAGDPGLLLERERLQRQVNMHQQVYVQLAEAFQQARINEVRDTPVITIVETPEVTVRREGGLLLDLLVWGVLGALVGVLLAIARESYWKHVQADELGEAGLGQLWRIALRQLVRAGRT